MPIEEWVFIAGAGPVGLAAAANLVRTRDGVIATFDFAAIADLTKHPYRVQSEQFKLTRILPERLCRDPNFRIELNSRVSCVEQDNAAVHVTLDRNGTTQRHAGRWLIGADGARSDVRRALGIEFAGFTWPERFLVVSTPFDFRGVIANLAPVSYVSDRERWHFLLEIPGLWRVMFPLAEAISDETAISYAFADSLMAGVVPGIADYEIVHTTLYKARRQEVPRRTRVPRWRRGARQ
jgi:2-polyprenyl-6-methoxyphenol hydroxylase-like FAD-dependent oxidoreductase